MCGQRLALREHRGEDAFDSGPECVVGQAAVKTRCPPAEDIVRAARPFVSRRVADLGHDVRTIGVQAFEERGIRSCGSEHFYCEASVEMEEMRSHVRLEAFHTLLLDGELDPRRTVMVQVAVPTRERIDHYVDERRRVEELVGEINGEFSSLGFQVLHYLRQSLPLEELIALYQAGDVMLVTPLRDGMNLVAKEFAASRVDEQGVLVLSEFAGAADELTDAVLVNPHDREALQRSILEAVDMRPKDIREWMIAIRETVAHGDVRRWASGFLDALRAA